MNKIPDRWLNYSRYGGAVEGTRFLPFKVPLKKEMCQRANIVEQKFTPSCLLQNFPKIGLVIDLTNTSRYYNPKEFTDNGVHYEKILCPGQQIPGSVIVKKFFNAVDEYLKKSPNDERLIGVHCTHGLNRTSYFICSYMIQKMEIPAEAAIKAFEEARGHQIERQPYVSHLKEKGGGGVEYMHRNPPQEYNMHRGPPEEKRNPQQPPNNRYENWRNVHPPHEKWNPQQPTYNRYNWRKVQNDQDRGQINYRNQNFPAAPPPNYYNQRNYYDDDFTDDLPPRAPPPPPPTRPPTQEKSRTSSYKTNRHENPRDTPSQSSQRNFYQNPKPYRIPRRNDYKNKEEKTATGVGPSSQSTTHYSNSNYSTRNNNSRNRRDKPDQ